jgi:hypothetical protein
MNRPTPGRVVLTLPLVGTALAPIFADWNDTHVFNPHWTGHARFHAVVGTCAAVSWALVGLWSLWRTTPDRRAADTIAALGPILYWGFFFVALATPGTAFEDPGHTLTRVAGLVPINVFVASMNVAVAILGWVLLRRAPPDPSDGSSGAAVEEPAPR